MKTFSATVTRISESLVTISLNGWIVEDCELPSVTLESDKTVLSIDCQELKGMNSIGIRTWMMWLKALDMKRVDHFEFFNMHPPILQQGALVSGFIPAKSVIRSFYVYYWSEELQEEKEYLVVAGKDYTDQKMSLPKFHKEVRNGKTYLFEIDITEKRVASFYKGQFEIVER